MKRHRPPPSDEDRLAEAALLVGRTLQNAVRRATKDTYVVRDHTEPGWYTDDLRLNRINVRLGTDGLVVEAWPDNLRTPAISPTSPPGPTIPHFTG